VFRLALFLLFLLCCHLNAEEKPSVVSEPVTTVIARMAEPTAEGLIQADVILTPTVHKILVSGLRLGLEPAAGLTANDLRLSSGALVELDLLAPLEGTLNWRVISRPRPRAEPKTTTQPDPDAFLAQLRRRLVEEQVVSQPLPPPEVSNAQTSTTKTTQNPQSEKSNARRLGQGNPALIAFEGTLIPGRARIEGETSTLVTIERVEPPFALVQLPAGIAVATFFKLVQDPPKER
jgi:hypothetical protein